LSGWTDSLERLSNDRQRWKGVLADSNSLKAQLQDAEAQIGAVFRTADGVTVTGELELLERLLDWVDGANSTGLRRQTQSQTRLLLLMARAAQARFGEPTAGRDGQRFDPTKVQQVYDRDWLPELLERFERKPRQSDLPPRLTDDARGELEVVNTAWNQFAWAEPARQLLVEQLQHAESSRKRQSDAAWRQSVMDGWQNALRAQQASTAISTRVRNAALGAFARRNNYYGAGFTLMAPAPDEDPMTNEARRIKWSKPLLLGQLHRDEVSSALGQPTEFWIHDVKLTAVTHDGRWIDLEFFVNLLEDSDRSAPLNLSGAKGFVEFGSEPIAAIWTFLGPHTVQLTHVRWWVVTWAENPYRKIKQELLRPDH